MGEIIVVRPRTALGRRVVARRGLRSGVRLVDLDRVVSKYIHETEKNLRRVFDEAEDSGAVLLFDEADALFGKRGEVREAGSRYGDGSGCVRISEQELAAAVRRLRRRRGR